MPKDTRWTSFVKATTNTPAHLNKFFLSCSFDQFLRLHHWQMPTLIAAFLQPLCTRLHTKQTTLSTSSLHLDQFTISACKKPHTHTFICTCTFAQTFSKLLQLYTWWREATQMESNVFAAYLTTSTPLQEYTRYGWDFIPYCISYKFKKKLPRSHLFICYSYVGFCVSDIVLTALFNCCLSF